MRILCPVVLKNCESVDWDDRRVVDGTPAGSARVGPGAGITPGLVDGEPKHAV